MSRARAEELKKMRTELSEKFADAMKAIDLKIAAESREEADDYAEVGKAATSLAKTTNSTADGILVARMFPRQGGPAR